MLRLPFKKPPLPEGRRRASVEGRAPIYSYHARRSLEQETTGRQIFRSRLDARQASRFVNYSVRRLGLIVALIALCGSVVSVSLVSTNPKVELLTAPQGVLLHPVSTYQQAAQRLLARSVMNRTKLSIDTHAISAGLKQEFPELDLVSIKLPLVGHRPVIYLTTTTSGLLLKTPSGMLYAVDADGRVLGLIKGPSPALPEVADQLAFPTSVGRLVLPRSTIAFTQIVAYQLQQKHIGISSFTLPASSSELDLYPRGEHYFVKFNLDDIASAQEQVGTFLAVRHYLQGKGQAPSQYIDVRITGRAYYK